MENKNNKSSPILVTGATGYLASHLIKLLLQKDYKVRGTIRSLANKDKYQFLYDLVPSKKDNLTLVEADLTTKSSWSAAIEGCQFIFHMASPLPSTAPKDENEVIVPAVEGTVNVLEAALAKGAKKVVVTSSCLSILVGNAQKVCTEEDWANEAYCSPYAKSKVKAEKAAWQFYEEHKGRIQMTVVNPILVLGPVLTKHGGASEAFIRDVLNGDFPGAMDIGLGIVDVRDVAECHYRVMFSDKTNGQRVACSSETKSVGQVIGYLKKEFGKYGYKIQDQPVTAEDAKKSRSDTAHEYAPLVGMNLRVDNGRSVKELGMKYIPVEKTLVDMGYSLIKNGIVSDKTQNKKGCFGLF